MDMKKAEKCTIFVEHIEKHLETIPSELRGNGEVICKICGKTIDEIYELETKKEHNLFIQPGIYEVGKKYIDRNGKSFYVKSERD